MSKRIIDFDQFRSEQKEEPVIFIIGGEEYSLPPALPASMAVDAMALQERMDDDDDVPPQMMDQFGRSLFGETVWEALLRRHRITVDEIPVVMEKVLEEYTDVPKAETEGSTSESEPSDSVSSETGPGSRPTSSESTESTSLES